ncbi:MAG: hypothetical protein WAX77_13635 [Methylococcaceae bacterium]
MMNKIILPLVFCVASSYAQADTAPVASPTAATLPVCQIVFDAGSSGTRLYIYQKQDNNWLEHPGPKVGALADPVREIRDKKHSDIDVVTTEVVSSLEAIKQDGSVNKKGNKEWPAFDWQAQCQVVSSMVYATAGMRIAEQENPAKSVELWRNLKQKLQAKVGANVTVTTRTLTGFEEGLYAWLAVREKQENNNFGIAEMGGASAQITFPCEKCDTKDDSTKTVLVKNNPVKMFSYSFLGLGQDEAPKTLHLPKTCAYGVGLVEEGKAKKHQWESSDCAKKIDLEDKKGIVDPYNYKGKHRGTHRKIPSDLADVNNNWLLTGAFNYMDDSQIDSCCLHKGQCFNEETACFRPIYLDKYLQSLNIPKTAQRMDASWTLGAVICEADKCLQQAQTPVLVCHWSKKGCLGGASKE